MFREATAPAATAVAAQISVPVVSAGVINLSSVLFRAATPADMDAIYQMSCPFMADGFLLERDLRLFYDNVSEFEIADIDGEIAGCLGIRNFGTLAELYNVCVHASWQGSGIGRLLVARALTMLHAQGVSQVCLFSKTTVSWFASLGFTPADPAELPAARLTLLDPARRAQFMVRSTVPGTDPLDGLNRIARPRIRFSRSQRELRWDDMVSSVLELAERNGMMIEHLCRAGICGSCCSRLEQGAAGYIDYPEVNLGDSEVLLCILQPITDLVIER